MLRECCSQKVFSSRFVLILKISLLNNNNFWFFVEQFTFPSTADNFEISLQMYKKMIVLVLV